MADRLALTSLASSGASNLEAHRHPLEMSVAFARQDLAGLDMNMTIPISSEGSSRGGAAVETPLSLWYERNDGPWIPQGLTSGQDDPRAQSMASNMRANSLAFPGQYRESFVPSECDTATGVIPSDSGYGSYNPRHSVANGSVCEESFDRNPETQRLIGGMGDLNFQAFGPEMLQKNGMNPGHTWGQPQGPIRDRHIHVEPAFLCETCGKPLRTNSELK
ncbi:Uu.00g102650.m01.CDS01 [Anthostomella pinea]|uniref:Uu.00g102650.m01.CDS01 n=1 Tax=Anthostomella pinea TaxID=933095 RepID=A0AAI8VEF0_9PEZI|nr:Uu.00g102650.m01.CDS01 [Anthostomella pinea]